MQARPVLVVGIGNILLQDEGVGVHVARALGEAVLPPDVEVLDGGTSGADIIEAIADRTHIPLDKFVINIDRYGNTSSASLPITFDEARRDGRMKPGQLVLMMAIGAGMTWSAGLYRA